MVCDSCGAGWFVEERLIRPAGRPTNPRIPVTPKETRIRYRCAACGHEYGAPVKKRGRPPKTKN